MSCAGWEVGGCPLHPLPPTSSLLLWQEMNRAAKSLHLFNMMVFAKEENKNENPTGCCFVERRCVSCEGEPLCI